MCSTDLNRFLRLIHRGELSRETKDQAIDAARAMLEEIEDPLPIKGQLQSAFPGDSWLDGELRAEDVIAPDWEYQRDHLEKLWKELCEWYPIREASSGSPYRFIGDFPIKQC